MGTQNPPNKNKMSYGLEANVPTNNVYPVFEIPYSLNSPIITSLVYSWITLVHTDYKFYNSRTGCGYMTAVKVASCLNKDSNCK